MNDVWSDETGNPPQEIDGCRVVATLEGEQRQQQPGGRSRDPPLPRHLDQGEVVIQQSVPAQVMVAAGVEGGDEGCVQHGPVVVDGGFVELGVVDECAGVRVPVLGGLVGEVCPGAAVGVDGARHGLQESGHDEFSAGSGLGGTRIDVDGVLACRRAGGIDPLDGAFGGHTGASRQGEGSSPHPGPQY